MEYKGLTLDKFQEDAIHSIENNNSVVVSAPTGSGKTLIADYIINRDLKKGIRVVYTSPIKALSNQKYKQFSEDYGEKNVGLLTGDIVINPEAPIIIMTTEIYRNMAIANDISIKNISYVIFDEVHYINDKERGYVWEESIIFSQSHVRMLCLSATIPNAEEFGRWISKIKKHKVDIIKHHERPVPLHLNFYDKDLGITNLNKIKEDIDMTETPRIRGRKSRKRFLKIPRHYNLIKQIKDKTPCLFFCFSRNICQRNAKDLSTKNIFKFNKDIVSYVNGKLKDIPSQIKQLESTKILRNTLPFGVGFHHAGLLPAMKEIVEELFSQGKINVLYTTETFAVGINMPAKTVCFESLRKFDGINFRMLNSKEYFQIAGRAGRRGIDKEGYVYVMVDRNNLFYHRTKEITSRDIEPIKSQFRLSINTVLNLIDMHTENEIHKILQNSLYSFQKYGNLKTSSKIVNRFNNIRKQLLKKDFIEKEKDSYVLTHKGKFASKIYSDEILTSELFASEHEMDFNEYHIFMLVAVLSYEPRERTIFYKKYQSPHLSHLKTILRKSDILGKDDRFKHMNKLTGIVNPIYEGKTIFDAIKNTNLLEGDIFRIFRQMLDRLGQIKNATESDNLYRLIKSVEQIIGNSMEGVDVI